MPIGLIFSHGRWRARLKPVTLFAYFWMGFYFLTFSFVLVQLLISLVIDHEYSYWPWIAASLAGTWSIYRALSPPRIITHEIVGLHQLFAVVELKIPRGKVPSPKQFDFR